MAEEYLQEKLQGFHYVRDSASFVFYLSLPKPIVAPEQAEHAHFITDSKQR